MKRRQTNVALRDSLQLILAPNFARDGPARYFGAILPTEDTQTERRRELRLAIALAHKHVRPAAVGVAPPLAGPEHVAARLNFVAFSGCKAYPGKQQCDQYNLLHANTLTAVANARQPIRRD